MNIFYLDYDPYAAAKMQVDKHVVKMILESAQMLSTAHRVLDGTEYIDASSGRKVKRWKLNDARDDILYSATHINHPSAVWVRQSKQNYIWLVRHFEELLREYSYRYEAPKTELPFKKVHKCEKLLPILSCTPNHIPLTNFFPPPCCMDPKYVISACPIENYRNYYKNGKAHIHKWTKRPKPSWI